MIIHYKFKLWCLNIKNTHILIVFYGKVKLKLFYLPKSKSLKVSMYSEFHQANKTYQTSNYYNYKQSYEYMCVRLKCLKK